MGELISDGLAIGESQRMGGEAANTGNVFLNQVRTSADSQPGQGTVMAGPDQGDTARATYEKKMSRLESELQAVIGEQPTDAEAAQIQDEILRFKEQMDAAILQADFLTANLHLDKIIDELAKYRQTKPTQKSQEVSKPKAIYEANLKGIKADLDQVTSGQAESNAQLAQKRQQIIDLNRQMQEAVFTGVLREKEPDYVKANRLAIELKQKLADYRTNLKAYQDNSAKNPKARPENGAQAKAASVAEKKLVADLEGTLNNPYPPPGDQKSRDIIGQIKKIKARLDESASYGGISLVLSQVEIELKRLLQDYQTTSRAFWKERYDSGLASIKKEDLKSALDKLKWVDQVMKAERDKVEAEKRAMEDLAARNDYYQANIRLSALTQQIEHLHTFAQGQEAARIAFEGKWKRSKDGLLKVLGLKPEEPELQNIHGQITSLDGHMKAALRNGDFVSAARHLDQLASLLINFGKTDKGSLRGRYDTALTKIRFSLAEALSRDWKSKEMTKLQAGVAKKKAEMEASAAEKDYVQGLKHLETLTGLVNEFLAETRKTSRGCDWVRDTAGLLHAKLHRKYLQSASKLDAAAQAYDDALKEHREALDSKPNLAEQFLIGLFFAGLGGVAGGVVGGAFGTKIKSMFDKAGKDTAVSGALIDSSKDIVKFVTRSAQNLNLTLPLPDPLAGLSAIDGTALIWGERWAKG